jgi:hypothetical protein
MRRWIGLLALLIGASVDSGCAEYQERRHLRNEEVKASLGTIKSTRERFANTTGPETIMPMTVP